jgi:hypothetical protein
VNAPFNTLIRPICEHMASTYRIAGGAPVEAMIVAIGLQESRFTARDQLEVIDGALVPGAVGPATGFWQFERGGGVRGVMRHASSRAIAQEMAQQAGVGWDETTIWTVFTRPEGDELACAFARLLLLTDPQPLPAALDQSEETAWQYYLRNWRPGKPHRGTWGAFWRYGVSLTAGEATSSPVPAPARPAVPVGLPAAALEARVVALEATIAAMRRALG